MNAFVESHTFIFIYLTYHGVVQSRTNIFKSTVLSQDYFNWTGTYFCILIVTKCYLNYSQTAEQLQKILVCINRSICLDTWHSIDYQNLKSIFWGQTLSDWEKRPCPKTGRIYLYTICEWNNVNMWVNDNERSHHYFCM